jgi:L-alanine-DL-glutamate epimerase-like enolase superfamily enzyme
MIQIKTTRSNFEREPLIAPFGFKGAYLTEAWQSVAHVESESGCNGVGTATQSPLWSDAGVFLNNSQAAGNALMYAMTEYALRRAREIGFDTPFELLDALLPDVYAYGQAVTGSKDLRLTFALNALVAVDNAAWQLYCEEMGISSFDEMVPVVLRSALQTKHSKLAVIPLMSYGVSIEAIKAAVDEGFFFLKIKIGSDPDKDGDLDKMVEWDKQRLSSIHELVKDRPCAHTKDGKIPYYLDANGRYDSKDRLMRLLDHAEKIGALERIMIVEEPFPEEYEVDVRDIPARLAADESAHSDKDALARIQMGYGAIALKPIAKTMSMSLRIAKLCHDHDVPAFCADLTVSPVLIDWNKNVAARLAPLPGMKIGVLETNGHQNYRNWEAMKGYHPQGRAAWTEMKNGLFTLGEDFYASSGGIFEKSEHYLEVSKG